MGHVKVINTTGTHIGHTGMKVINTTGTHIGHTGEARHGKMTDNMEGHLGGLLKNHLAAGGAVKVVSAKDASLMNLSDMINTTGTHIGHTGEAVKVINTTGVHIGHTGEHRHGKMTDNMEGHLEGGHLGHLGEHVKVINTTGTHIGHTGEARHGKMTDNMEGHLGGLLKNH